MPEYLAPGVFVEEVSFRARTIEPAVDPVTVFVGPTTRGRIGVPSPVIESFAAFRRGYGGLADLRIGGGQRLLNHVAHAAQAFFREGGRRLQIVRVGGGDGRSPSLRGYQAALRVVDRIEGLRTVAAPGSSALPALADDVRAALITHAARSGRRSCVLLDPDPSTPPASARALATAFDAPDAALYYPWIAVRSPTGGGDLLIPPSGAVAGILARVAAARGLHRAPGNEPIASATGLERALGAAEARTLNPDGVSVLRQFPARGIRVWGARTLSSDPEWRYLNVRRYVAYVEHSIDRGTRWAAFEPNDESLWAQLRLVVSGFLLDEWRAGRLQGSRPSEAYFVSCDRSTMTAADLRARRLIAQVGLAPLRPAEFVVLRVEQPTA
ncbi:MAG: phage tail sheath subtilisin-like domain-containing protein [Pseudomonadales bacterium]|jgi:phage tail sheath protein FI|nr:phage tail sheath subtilisin-like domain-containing protein [Pseudomonadales bacterium]